MANKELLLSLFASQIKDKLEYLEKRNTSENSCLTLLSTNMKDIESKFLFLLIFI